MKSQTIFVGLSTLAMGGALLIQTTPVEASPIVSVAAVPPLTMAKANPAWGTGAAQAAVAGAVCGAVTSLAGTPSALVCGALGAAGGFLSYVCTDVVEAVANSGPGEPDGSGDDVSTAVNEAGEGVGYTSECSASSVGIAGDSAAGGGAGSSSAADIVAGADAADKVAAGVSPDRVRAVVVPPRRRAVIARVAATQLD